MVLLLRAVTNHELGCGGTSRLVSKNDHAKGL